MKHHASPIRANESKRNKIVIKKKSPSSMILTLKMEKIRTMSTLLFVLIEIQIDLSSVLFLSSEIDSDRLRQSFGSDHEFRVLHFRYWVNDHDRLRDD